MDFVAKSTSEDHMEISAGFAKSSLRAVFIRKSLSGLKHFCLQFNLVGAQKFFTFIFREKISVYKVVKNLLAVKV